MWLYPCGSEFLPFISATSREANGKYVEVDRTWNAN